MSFDDPQKLPSPTSASFEATNCHIVLLAVIFSDNFEAAGLSSHIMQFSGFLNMEAGHCVVISPVSASFTAVAFRSSGTTHDMIFDLIMAGTVRVIA